MLYLLSRVIVGNWECAASSSEEESFRSEFASLGSGWRSRALTFANLSRSLAQPTLYSRSTGLLADVVPHLTLQPKRYQNIS